MADSSQIVNPLAPLAYLPPATSVEYRISVYAILGSAGAFLVDLISNVHSDRRLLVQNRIAFPTLVYFFSRLAVLASLVINSIFRTAALGLDTCKDFQIASCVTYHLAFASTTLLFYLRVRAIYNRNKFVIYFFLFLWVSVLAATLTVAFSGGAKIMGPTKYCVGVPVQPYVAASPITIAVNDTCVYLAISWRLLWSSYIPHEGESTSSKLGNVLSGRHLPALSRAVFQDGQAYYLFSVISNILAVYTVTAPGMPINYRFMYAFNCVVANMMACRVFRHTKFGDFREEAISTSVIHMQGRAGRPVSDLVNPTTNSGNNRSATRNRERDLMERLSPGLLLGSIIFVMILIPVVCVYICLHKRHKEAMK